MKTARLLFVSALALSLAACAGSADDATDDTLGEVPTTLATTCPDPAGEPTRTASFVAPPAMCIDAAKTYQAVLKTSEGDITVALDAASTPVTVNNFVVLARHRFYDNTLIFRTDPELGIIQGGGMSNTDSPGYTIADEGSGYHYTTGVIAMARTGAPNSAGSQFFIVTSEAASVLDAQGTYVVFGKVSAGMDVVQTIQALNTGTGALGGEPSRPVVVETVEIRES